MAESKEQQRTLEMRVAELEDKLAKVHISEEEMKTYQKVAAALAGGGMAGAQPSLPTPQALPTYSNCWYRPCYYYYCYYRYCYYQADCIPVQQQGPMMQGPGGFGSFGG